jgi:hypothetical protein
VFNGDLCRDLQWIKLYFPQWRKSERYIRLHVVLWPLARTKSSCSRIQYMYLPVTVTQDVNTNLEQLMEANQILPCFWNFDRPCRRDLTSTRINEDILPNLASTRGTCQVTQHLISGPM